MEHNNDFLFYMEGEEHLFVVSNSPGGSIMRYDPVLDEEVEASRQELIDLFVGRVKVKSSNQERLSVEKRYRRMKWLQENTSEFVQDPNETVTRILTADSHINRVSCNTLKTDLKEVAEYRCGSVVLPGKYDDMNGIARSVLLSGRIEFADCERYERKNVSIIGVIAPAIIFSNPELRDRALILMSDMATEYVKICSRAQDEKL